MANDLNGWSSGTTLPAHIGSIVEVNGHRLTPPFTRYGHFTQDDRTIQFRRVIDPSQIKIWLNGTPFEGTVAIVPFPSVPITDGWDGEVWTDDPEGGNAWDGDPPTQMLAGSWNDKPFEAGLFDVEGDIVLFDSLLYANGPAVYDKHVLAVAYRSGGGYETSPEYDYDITTDGGLSVYRPLGFGDFDYKDGGWETFDLDTGFSPDTNARIEVTSFQNGALMGMETHSFDGEPSGEYVLETNVPTTDFLMVWLNGRRLVNNVEFQVSSRAIGFGDDYFAEVFDDADQIIVLTIPGGQKPNDAVVVNAFTGRPLEEPQTWGMLSSRPALSMLGPRAFAGEFDVAPLATKGLDTMAPAVGVSSQGDRALFTLEGSFDIIQWPDEDAVALDQDLGIADEEIVVRKNPLDAPPEFVPLCPLQIPDISTNTPGVLWINGERIEYFTLARDDDKITLGQLRRGTRGTRVSVEQRSQLRHKGDGTKTVYVLPNCTATREIEVSVISSSGQMVGLSYGVHYTVEQDGPNANVTFATAPGTTDHVRIGISTSVVHKAGTICRVATAPTLDPKSPFRTSLPMQGAGAI